MTDDKLPAKSGGRNKVTVSMRFPREVVWLIEKLRADFRPSFSRNQAVEPLLIEALEARGLRLEDVPKDDGDDAE